MKKRLLDLRGQVPLLDIVSYGRGGPRSMTQTQREQVARTTGRVPEVMVKVSGGARTLAGVERHMDYVGRKGELGMESDTGERLQSRRWEADLILDWNLDLEAHQRQNQRSIRSDRKPPKLVHNVIFSMPPGTPPDAVLRAVRKLAVEKLALRHRYAMVLHTDEPHPHVHLVVKAMNEQGERLNIRKATLREWRQLFAANLRELGVAANATERAVRGQPSIRKRDGIYRAAQRGDSVHMRERSERAAAELSNSSTVPETGKKAVLATRQAVVDGWRAVQTRLRQDGHGELAEQVSRFVDRMPRASTEKELLMDELRTPARPVEPPHRTR
jgi:Relaxase/Mobilisation nuclease domain